MKYYPSYWRYVKKDYLYFVEQVQMDYATAESFYDYFMVGIGYFLILVIPTIMAPFFAVILYKEWCGARKPYTEEFIEQL